MDFSKMIDAAKAENSGGIDMRGGKKYTSTAVRMEIFRRHVSGAYGISTEIVEYGRASGDPIVVRATIRDEAGRVIAMGTAEEIRGQGNVNKTSALENAETSAIGRALAMLGLSGGEFASLNEMDGVDRKAAAIAAAASGPATQRQEPRKEPPTFEQVTARYAARLAEMDSIAALNSAWDSVMGVNPAICASETFKAAFDARMAELPGDAQ
jgi:hypothetical protein